MCIGSAQREDVGAGPHPLVDVWVLVDRVIVVASIRVVFFFTFADCADLHSCSQALLAAITALMKVQLVYTLQVTSRFTLHLP